MKTAKEYKDSLRDRNIKVYLKGELLDPKTLIDHPFVRGHVNSAAMTYALASTKEYEDLMTATSHLTGRKINRFTHIHQSGEEGQDAAYDLPEDRYLLSALRGLRRDERHLFRDLRVRSGHGHELS